jgi:hypothetical protein|tara:strand:- start:3 stop:149 length:147 start_codon:yes stop_codon:yes gene_type:complete
MTLQLAKLLARTTQGNASILEHFVHAAMCCMNDRFSRRSAALEFTQVQ